MPLFYQHNINDFSKLGVWEITEDEDFFLAVVSAGRSIPHKHKRVQHLAGRYLLPVLFDDFLLSDIDAANSQKPFLRDGRYQFSISHCGAYAAAIVSSRQQVGIDIELVTPKIERVKEKFLNDAERKLLKSYEHLPKIYLQLLTVLWSAKEAIFKWYGRREVDFKQHIQLATDRIVMDSKEHMVLPFVFSKETNRMLKVEVKIWNDELVLAWVRD